MKPTRQNSARIAVVGAGLAGLSAAWWLRGLGEVTLFERQSQPGFTSQSLSVPDAAGAPQRVDVPLRVFYPGYYPTLSALYAELGIASQAVSYAATLTDPTGRAYFRYRNLRWGERSWGVWAPRDAFRGLRAWRIVAGMLRFLRAARRVGDPGTQGIAEFAQGHGAGRDFVEGLLLPAICTVCTCDTAQARELPADVVLDYLRRGLTRQAVRRAMHGADAVQARLLQDLGPPHCNARIVRLRRTRSAVHLAFEDGHEEPFDHVVLATQGNQALALLGGDARLDEAAALDAFAYVPVDVVTHRDPALMPARRVDWSPVNLMVDAAHPAPESTIWINAVQPALRGAADVFQTVHPLRQPQPALIIGRARFERPVVGPATATAWLTLGRLHGEPDRRIWFCGSYAQAGIPLLESAVASARHVADALGQRLDTTA